ncbi:MAG: class I tRNA ligase family protein, partial [Firmicutes bacterium]|nr:class I tRNA ligase family protein [Bacillota bacterium]
KYREGAMNEALFGTATKNLIVMLAPFIPHVAEEMWDHIGQEGSVHDCLWPDYDESALVKDTVEIVVQINGKIKERMDIAGDLSREEMQAACMEDDKVKALIEGKNVVKVIAVPGKLINIVVK